MTSTNVTTAEAQLETLIMNMRSVLSTDTGLVLNKHFLAATKRTAEKYILAAAHGIRGSFNLTGGLDENSQNGSEVTVTLGHIDKSFKIGTPDDQLVLLKLAFKKLAEDANLDPNSLKLEVCPPNDNSILTSIRKRIFGDDICMKAPNQDYIIALRKSAFEMIAQTMQPLS